ncbi:DUF2062 domain-containing protein [Pseudodesulfovibrio sp.]|nr:DUF2062 domain-containing protein [Pseudodesulfovibrio sp.]
MRELTLGISPSRVALASILGMVSATWPQIGTNPIMALLLSWLFRCNKAITSGISLVFTPLQYALMIPFLRLGETLLGLEHFETTVPEIVYIVVTDPIGSFKVLGMPLVHAIVGWSSAWLVIGPLIFPPTRWLMRRISNKKGRD